MDIKKTALKAYIFCKRRVCRPVRRWYGKSWQKSKCNTLAITAGISIFVLLTLFGPICWFCNGLKWLLYDGIGSPEHGYIIMMLWLTAASVFGFILAQTYSDQFRQKIAIPLLKWIAPEFPMRGITSAISVGCLLAMIGLVSIPETLRIFGWLHGGRIAPIPYFATISALAIAPVTTLVWYWRHLYKKREREHNLLTLATESLADKDSASVRITGLYTLKELVEANPAKLIDVINILCGFLKHRYHNEEKEWHKQGHDYKKLPKIDFGRAPDIRVALNVFSEIWQSRFNKEKKYLVAMEFTEENKLENYRPDLNRVNFLQSDLIGICLRQTDLSGSDLCGTSLLKCDLQKAFLQEANLQGSQLWKANLMGAYLRFASLQGAFLFESNAQSTDFTNANLQGAKLHNSKLQGARLCNVNLQGACLVESNLRGACLENAKIGGADFSDAKLHGTITRDPDFSLHVGAKTEINAEMLNQTYTEEEIQSTISVFKKIRPEISNIYFKQYFHTVIADLQSSIGKKPIFPNLDDSKYCGELTLAMVLEILNEWPEKMQRKQLEILKELGFNVPDRL